MPSMGRNDFSINEGKKKERTYDWIAAVDTYGNALLATLGTENLLMAAEIHERIGYCYYNAARQADDLQQFKSRMLHAADEYNEAAEILEKLEDRENSPRYFHLKAMSTYMSSWLRVNYTSRKESLDECTKLEKQALGFYIKSNDLFSLGNTYTNLSTFIIDRFELEWNPRSREKLLREALAYGEKAIAILSKMRKERELARAYCITSIHYHTAALGFEKERKKAYADKTLSYAEKAMKLSEKAGDRLLFGMSNVWFGTAIVDFTENQGSARRYFETALQCGVETRDNYLVGRASYLIAHMLCWEMFAELDPKKKIELSTQCRKYSEDAVLRFGLISQDNEIASSYYCSAENYSVIAMSAETNRERKRVLLRKSIKAGKKGLEHARQSHSIAALWFITHPLSKSLFYLSTLETDVRAKKNLLRASLRYRNENNRSLEAAMPYYFWNHGVYYHYLALIHAELAALEQNNEPKVALLESAVKNAEDCVDLCLETENLSHEQYVALGGYYNDLGRILDQLHSTTRKREILDKQLKAYAGALKVHEKTHLYNCVAESHWQLANTHSKLRNFEESSNNFELAYENYILAAEKVSSLKNFYLYHAYYMKGWSEIERARHCNERQDYDQAREHYEKAADLHAMSGSWKYLAPTCSAWAQLEHGHDLSAKELGKEAIQVFHEASRLFEIAKESIRTAVKVIDSREEREKALALAAAAEIRQEYCRGRIVLEEAIVCDMQGQAGVSAEKYDSASKLFGKVAEKLEDESEGKELCSLIFFCQAWHKMKLAEERLTPSFYLEASELFMKAKECSGRERLSLFAMGNNALCKALEAGAKFESTGDLNLYSLAKQTMESAANYYLKAGLERASIWVNANQTLLDAYIYMRKAEAETTPDEKIQEYRLAERCLERAAELCKKAGYTGKRNEVLKVLESVKEKRQFAVSLSSALVPPVLTSDMKVFPVPAFTEGEAVGIDRFEHLNVQASLSMPEEVIVGDIFALRVDLVNVAKERGMLVRIDNLIPVGFKIIKIPSPYVLEGKSLNAGGRQLAPHKVESIEILVNAAETGTFQVSPAVIYVDELGSFKKFKCQTAQVLVSPPASFQFKTNNAQRVFEFLMKEFVSDYMKRNLPIEKSGWRTRVQIQKNAKVSKTSLYGTAAYRGRAITELENRGLAETRLFEGERGRGGKITKTRIYYEKEIIRRFIDEHIMKKKEK